MNYNKNSKLKPRPPKNKARINQKIFDLPVFAKAAYLGTAELANYWSHDLEERRFLLPPALKSTQVLVDC